jgi:hypothetical protein
MKQDMAARSANRSLTSKAVTYKGLAYLGQVMLLSLPMAKKETTFAYSYETWKDMIENATHLTNSRPPTPAIPPDATSAASAE